MASIADGLASDKPQLWEKANGNVLYDHVDTFTTAAGAEATTSDVDAVFAAADRVITERLSCPRQSNQPMETRGSMVEVDPDTGHMTIHNATQSSHALRWIGAALTGKQTTHERREGDRHQQAAARRRSSAARRSSSRPTPRGSSRRTTTA